MSRYAALFDASAMVAESIARLGRDGGSASQRASDRRAPLPGVGPDLTCTPDSSTVVDSMAARREPEWGEAGGIRGNFEFLTYLPVPPSGNPLDLLTPVDRLIYLGKAFRVPMTDVAKALRMSRETVYLHLRRAHATLETVPARPAPQPGKLCACGEVRPAGRRHCATCWRERMRNRGRAAADASVEVGGDGAGT
jgi:hypothetical protein